MNFSFDWFFKNFSLMRDWMYLEAQLDAVYWAKIATFVSVASLIVSTAALVWGFWSLILTRKSVRENREIGEAQTRSYIVITGAEAFIYNAGSKHNPIDRYKINIYAEVCGQTPVRDVTLTYAFYEKFKSNSEIPYYEVVKEYLGGKVPGEKFDAFNIASPLEDCVEDDNYMGDHDAILLAKVAFRVEGKIEYWPVVGNEVKTTSFAYEFGEHYSLGGSDRELLPRPIPEMTTAT